MDPAVQRPEQVASLARVWLGEVSSPTPNPGENPEVTHRGLCSPSISLDKEKNKFLLEMLEIQYIWRGHVEGPRQRGYWRAVSPGQGALWWEPH